MKQLDFIVPKPDTRDHCINPFGPMKYGGYAHFPGTGPHGTHCLRCVYKKRSGKGVHCLKWIELMKFTGACKNAPKIDSASPSCKYYEEREAK